MPTMNDKQRYYLNKECIDNYHMLWICKNKEQLNAKCRARYAERKKAGLMRVVAGELEIELLNL